jgi:hypothetical protein
MAFIPTNKILSQVTGTVSTTDNTPTFIVAVEIATNSGILVMVEVIGTRKGGSAGNPDDIIFARLLSEYKNVNDVVTPFGTPEKYVDKDNVNCDVNLVIDGTRIDVQVTGDTNNDYDWSAKASFFSLAFGQEAPPPPMAFAARNSGNNSNWLFGGDAASLQTVQNDSFILAGWVMLKDTNEGYILTKGEDFNTTNDEYSMYVSAGSGVITFNVNLAAPSTSVTVDSEPLSVDVPAFVLAWADAGAQTINIQINGGTVNTGGNPYIRTTNPPTGGNFVMFANDDGAGGIGGNEVLDEWFFCKNPADMATAISTIQSSIYNGGMGKRFLDVTSGEKTTIGLVSWWALDEDDNTTRMDSFGSNNLTNNGTITKAPSIVPFTPADLPGLTGWFRGSNIGVSDGASVSTWSDESGNENDANQVTSVNQPVFRAIGGANSLPCVEFNKSVDNQYLTIAGIAPTFAGSPSNFTFFVVSALTDLDLDNFNYTILSATRNTSNTVHEQFTVSDTPEYVYRESDDAPGGHGGAISSAADLVANTFEIFTVETDPTSATFYRGGVSVGSFGGRGGGGGRVYSPNQVSIGADRRFGVQDGANAKVSEIIIYDSPLSSTDLNKVGNYLATKYGLPWTNI